MPPLVSERSTDGFDDVSFHEPCCVPVSRPVKHSQKSVRLNLEHNVHEIPHFEELSEAEIANLWITPEDCERLRLRLMESVAKLNHQDHKPFDEESDTSRGLEYFTYSAAIQRECKKLRLQRSVMEEQERQRQTGENDVDELARVAVAARCSGEGIDVPVKLLAELEWEEEDFVDELLEEQSILLRPVLRLCCWNVGLSYFRNGK